MRAALILSVLLVQALLHAAANAKEVSPNTYIRAEVDFALADFQKNAGGKVNEFFYITKPTPLDEQTVVRMNRDTLYAGAVVDTEGGATITIPEFPDDRYFSVFIVDNDHYALRTRLHVTASTLLRLIPNRLYEPEQGTECDYEPCRKAKDIGP